SPASNVFRPMKTLRRLLSIDHVRFQEPSHTESNNWLLFSRCVDFRELASGNGKANMVGGLVRSRISPVTARMFKISPRHQGLVDYGGMFGHRSAETKRAI